MPSVRYRVPAALHRVEEEIKQSRFVTTVAPASTLEAARSLIGAVTAEFGDANHNCWAYVVGPPGSTSQIGMSDDGEPHGTAGRPMLNVLLHSNLGAIAAVVTRYFGGTLLGAGGLARAYSGGVQLALQSLPTLEWAPQTTLDIVVDYSAVTPVQRMLAEFEAVIASQAFGADAMLRIVLPQEQADRFTARLVDMTGGLALVEVAVLSD